MQLHAPVNTKPLHSDFVKEVRVSERLDDPDTIRQLKDTWHSLPVLIFRRQILTEEELVK
jgi:hypothetical protein